MNYAENILILYGEFKREHNVKYLVQDTPVFNVTSLFTRLKEPTNSVFIDMKKLSLKQAKSTLRWSLHSVCVFVVGGRLLSSLIASKIYCLLFVGWFTTFQYNIINNAAVLPV